jgi:hypothetical protein
MVMCFNESKRINGKMLNIFANEHLMLKLYIRNETANLNMRHRSEPKIYVILSALCSKFNLRLHVYTELLLRC